MQAGTSRTESRRNDLMKRATTTHNEQRPLPGHDIHDDSSTKHAGSYFKLKSLGPVYICLRVFCTQCKSFQQIHTKYPLPLLRPRPAVFPHHCTCLCFLKFETTGHQSANCWSSQQFQHLIVEQAACLPGYPTLSLQLKCISGLRLQSAVTALLTADRLFLQRENHGVAK